MTKWCTTTWTTHHHNSTTMTKRRRVWRGYKSNSNGGLETCHVSSLRYVSLFFFSFLFLLMIYLLTGRLCVRQHQHQHLALVNTNGKEGPEQWNHHLGSRSFFSFFSFFFWLLFIRFKDDDADNMRMSGDGGKWAHWQMTASWGPC